MAASPRRRRDRDRGPCLARGRDLDLDPSAKGEPDDLDRRPCRQVPGEVLAVDRRPAVDPRDRRGRGRRRGHVGRHGADDVMGTAVIIIVLPYYLLIESDAIRESLLKMFPPK